MNAPFNFKSEQVHLVDPRDGGPALSFRCHRCYRDLPQECFGPVGTREVSGSSLGLKYRDFIILHPLCWTCRKQATGRWTKHPDYSPAMDRYWNKAMIGVKAGARARKILVALDKDDMMGLFFQQEKRCAVTGMEMDWKAKGYAGRGGTALNAPSLDRIDSNGNYTLGNVHMVVRAVNIMKNDMPMKTFVEMCRRVVAGYEKRR